MLDPCRAKPTHCSVCALHHGAALALPGPGTEALGPPRAERVQAQHLSGLGRLAVALGTAVGQAEGDSVMSDAGSQLPPAAGTPVILAGTDCTSSE